MSGPVVDAVKTGLSGPFVSRHWLGSLNTSGNLSNTELFQQARVVMVGLPYDGTCSNRPGTRFAPAAIRHASWGLETYSPSQEKDLSEAAFFDAGDLELPLGNRDQTLACIRRAAEETLASGKKWLGVGGEHLVTLPVIEAYVRKYPDLAILHFDAHADLRDDYLGEKLSHATVLRRCVELITPERLVQVGIRSGPEEEFLWMKRHGTLLNSNHPAEIARGLSRLQDRPVFLTLDLDVLDPSVMSGTGTPEPGGMMFHELQHWLLAFKDLNFVGADVLELSPDYDPSGVSTAVAAKVLREVLLLL